jgi:hypothetical protein
MKIHTTGTVMASGKDFPSDLKKKKLWEYGLCVFHDKKLVTMLSTFFGLHS